MAGSENESFDFLTLLKSSFEDPIIFRSLFCTSFLGFVVILRLLTKNAPGALFFLIIVATYLGSLVYKSGDIEIGYWDQPYYLVSLVVIYLSAPLLIFSSSMGINFSELSMNGALAVVCIFIRIVLSVLLSTFTVWPILHFSSGMTLVFSFLFILMLTPCWVEFSVSSLDQVLGHIQDTQMMLRLEQLCSTWFACVMLEIVYKLYIVQTLPGFQTYHIAIVLSSQAIGLLVGAIMGFMVRSILNFAYNDITAQILISVFSIYIVHLICVVIGTNQSLAVGLFGILVNSNKVKGSKEAEEFSAEVWKLLLFIAKALICALAGHVLGMKRPGVFGLHHYGMIVIIFCILTAYRQITIALTQLCLNKKRELFWKRMIIEGMGSFSGAPCLVKALQYTKYDEDLGFLVLTYILGICAFSLFFNVMLFNTILKILGMFEYKKAAIENMNCAVNQINMCRGKAIFSLKMKFEIADANWKKVENITRLPHPYKKKLVDKGYLKEEGDFRLRTVPCPKCKTDVIDPPTKRQIEEMMIEAKQRALKIQLVSFSQQYESGTLSHHGYRTLSSVIDTSANSGFPEIDSTPLNIQTEESKITRSLRMFLDFCAKVTDRSNNYIPKNLFRIIAYRLAISRSANIFMAFLALADSTIILVLLIMWSSVDESKGFANFSDSQLTYGRIAQIFDLVFYILFLLEFVIHIVGLGCGQFFSSHINKMEAGAFCVRSTELLLYFIESRKLSRNVSVLLTSDIIKMLKYLLLVRFIRIYVFLVLCIPRCLSWVQKQAEAELTRNYEVGKGYLVSLDSASKFFNHAALYEPVSEAVKGNIQVERQKVARALSEIQKEHPSLAITVKTRHAIRVVINSMADCMNGLKEDGRLDLNEYKAMVDSLEKVRNDLRVLPMVEPAMAQGVLKDITWLSQDEARAKYIGGYAELLSFNYNDKIISHGDEPIGIYVLVSGLVKAYYVPSKITSQLNSMFGLLPNYDFFEVLKFDQPQDCYVVSGNVIGEISVATGRRADMNVYCETSVQLYYVPFSALKKVIHESENNEIESNIWKCIGLRIGVSLIQANPHFKEWTRDQLFTHLGKGWVPPLQVITCLKITEDISDIILIEGVCQNADTQEVYKGPYHLPKGIKLLLLPDHPDWDFQTTYPTRILIVPVNHHVMKKLAVDMYEEHHQVISRHSETSRSKERKVGFDSEPSDDFTKVDTRELY